MLDNFQELQHSLFQLGKEYDWEGEKASWKKLREYPWKQ